MQFDFVSRIPTSAILEILTVRLRTIKASKPMLLTIGGEAIGFWPGFWALAFDCVSYGIHAEHVRDRSGEQ